MAKDSSPRTAFPLLVEAASEPAITSTGGGRLSLVPGSYYIAVASHETKDSLAAIGHDYEPGFAIFNLEVAADGTIEVSWS